MNLHADRLYSIKHELNMLLEAEQEKDPIFKKGKKAEKKAKKILDKIPSSKIKELQTALKDMGIQDFEDLAQIDVDNPDNFHWRKVEQFSRKIGIVLTMVAGVLGITGSVHVIMTGPTPSVKMIGLLGVITIMLFTLLSLITAYKFIYVWTEEKENPMRKMVDQTELFFRTVYKSFKNMEFNFSNVMDLLILPFKVFIRRISLFFQHAWHNIIKDPMLLTLSVLAFSSYAVLLGSSMSIGR